MSRALGPLWDYLAAMDRRDRFMAARDQWQHPRHAARLEGGENEYGQPGISCAFPCPAHSSGRTVTASGRSQFLASAASRTAVRPGRQRQAS
jgi:hypothetical protein